MAWEYYNPNPVRTDGVGDCAVRAVAKALGMTWERAYAELCMNGFLMGDLPNANHVIGALLREYGFKRKSIPDDCPECFSVSDFCKMYPVGTYVVFSQNHVSAICNGILYDAWDSSENIPQFYWYLEKK